MEEQISQITETVIPILVDYGLEVIGALVILVVGWTAAGWISRRVRKVVERSGRIDDTLGPIFVKGTRILVLALTVLAVLNQFGVQTASIIAVLGTIGLAIGLALQGTLSNIASGMMLLILRPFNVGDAVDIGGTLGVVDEIGLFVTHMHTFDNVAIVMPNSNIWGGKIENYTRNTTRRADMEFGISYDDDIDKAMEIINAALAADERVLTEPEPLVAVNNLADSAVVLVVRAWTRTDDLWPFRFDFTKHIKERFDEEGVSFPFPQQDVHLYKNGENQPG